MEQGEPAPPTLPDATLNLNPNEQLVYATHQQLLAAGEFCGREAICSALNAQGHPISATTVGRALRLLRSFGLIPPRPNGDNRPAGQFGFPSRKDTYRPSRPSLPTTVTLPTTTATLLPATLLDLLKSQPDGCGLLLLCQELNLSPQAVTAEVAALRQAGERIEALGEEGSGTPEAGKPAAGYRWVEPPPPPKAVFPDRISPTEIGYPEADKDELIARLQEELAELKAREEWITHSDAGQLAGGTMTLNLSDLHYTCRGHLIQTAKSLEEKVLHLIDRFQPRRFQGLVNGDVVQGRGVYRNQLLDNILPKAQQQIGAAVFRFWEFDQKIASAFPSLPRTWSMVSGNHDASEGEPTMMPFVWGLRQFEVPAKFVGLRFLMDLGDVPYYVVMALHGYGASTYNSSPNKLIHETLKTVVSFQQRGWVNEKRIRRVCHGHCHWRNVGVEHAEDLPFDVTGGLHRNDRVALGMNNRPAGWIVYVSPPGTSEIITPIEVIPSPAILRGEIDDPELENKNRIEAARCLAGFAEEAKRRGIMSEEAVES